MLTLSLIFLVTQPAIAKPGDAARQLQDTFSGIATDATPAVVRFEVEKRDARCAELEELLQRHGLDVSGWGQGAAKSVEQLHSEVQKGETKLTFKEGRVLRYMHAARMRITLPGSAQVLYEAKQILPNGAERRRDDLPGEKMRPGEDAEAAALRGAVERHRDLIGGEVLADEITVESVAGHDPAVELEEGAFSLDVVRISETG